MYVLHAYKHNIRKTTTKSTLLQPRDNYEANSLRSQILILFRRSFLSWVTSSANPTAFKSSLISSFKLFFGRPLFLLPSGILILSHLLTGASTLLFTWPNHLSLISLILSFMRVTLTKSLITTIPNPIDSCITTHPPKHAHLCYHQPLDLCLFIG